MKAQIYNFQDWIAETDPKILFEKFDALLRASGFGVISFQEKHFEPFGFTCLWLLSESHFAIHTFPEHGKSYIELSSCVIDQYKRFVENI